ncbi:MAG: ABC transporter ATP-binding protein [Chloroflexota bacterium]|nr:ABC transporter ATP-binding protein [Chloroflexota bacterium]
MQARSNDAPLALQLERVSQRYGDLWAVRDLTLAVGTGSVVGLIGPNGSGKTTTIRLATGLLRVPVDSVRISGVDLAREPVRAKRLFALVPDAPTGFEHLSVSEYLGLYGSLHEGDDGYRSRCATLLNAMQLSSHEHRLLGTLSAGMRRKVSMIAAASIFAPLLVVDEATSALDPESVMVLEELLRFAADNGHAAFVATQDLDFAERACDIVFLMAKGQVVASGTPNDLRSKYGCGSLREVFAKATGLSDLIGGIGRELARTITR